MKTKWLLSMLLGCSAALAQPNFPKISIFPKWSDITVFGWQPNTVADSMLENITTVQAELYIRYAWGQPPESYICGYERRDSFFESRFACSDSPGRVWPPERRGEGAFMHDSLFQRRFEAQRLFRILRSIRQPAPYWQEGDFDNIRTKFRMDLSKIPRGLGERSFDLAGSDAPTYIFVVRLLDKNGRGPSLGSALIPFSYLDCAKAETLQAFPLHALLEWLYCCQLNCLFFPENVALNATHFDGKHMERLPGWARTVFPELNR